MMTNLRSSSVARLRFLLVILVMMFATTEMWGAEDDTHNFSQSISQSLNNCATFDDIVISEQDYSIKSVIITYAYNKSASPKATVSIGNEEIGTQSFGGTGNLTTTKTLTFTPNSPIKGEVRISNTAGNSCSGTGKGTLKITNICLVEGSSTNPPSPHIVKFYITSTQFKTEQETSAGDGVFPPSMEQKCGDWTFQGWSESYSDSETSTTELNLVTLTDDKYYPTAADVHLYPVYSKTISSGSAFSDYQKVTTNLDDWSGKYLLSTGTYTATGVYSSNHLTCTNGAPGNVECSGQEFTLSKVGNVGYSILMPNGNYLGYSGSSTNFSSSPNVPTSTSTTFLWTPSTSGISNVSATVRKISTNNDNTDFRPYSSPSSGIVYLYKRIENSSTTYYYSYPSCTAEPTVTLNPNGGTFASTPDGWNLEGNNYKKEDVTGAITLPTPTKTGYNFDGWYDGETKVNSSYTPSETVTLVANWTAKTTNITLNANTNNHGSGSDSSVKATYNQALPNFTPCTPATGYTLNGYFTAATSGTKIIDKDGNLVSGVSGYTSADGKWANEFATLTLYAQYVASQYTVTFDANGGTGTMTPQTFTHGVSQPLSANQFTREHYTFKGWTINQDGSGHLFEDQVSTVIPSSLTILYAQWTPIEYVIILDANQPEGHVPSYTTTNAEGRLLPHAFPSEACKQDWTFAGWSETDVTEETTTAPTTLYTEGTKYNPTRDITLYAVFSKTDEAFGFTKYEKVTSAPSDWSGKYLISNGTQTATGTQFSKSALAIANFIPGTDEKTEYEFTISKNGNNENYYILSPDGTYYVGGTTGSSNKADLIFSDNPNEDKYLWNLSASNPMTKNNASDRYIGVGSESSTSVFKQYSTSGNNAECYLYKRIEETSSTTTYNSNPSCVPTHTITWMNGDDVLGQDKVEEGKTPEYAGDEPTKAADAQYTYTFKGWTPDIVEATADATYTATYTATVNKYTITWKNGETTLENDENVPYGTEPSYNGAPPTKAATAQYTYTFKGWNPEVTSVIGNATYTATFTETVNKYQVTFNMNGHDTAPATQTIAYGSKVSEPSAPTADGYKFAGWYKDEQCTIPWNFGTDVITGNTTIHAKWLQIFTITWKANGLEYTTTNVTEGEPITPPASPDLGDYCGQVFAGWTTAEMEGTANVAPTLYPNPTPFPTATKEAPKTYYAVFADYED